MKLRHRAASCIMALCMIFTLLGTGIPTAQAEEPTIWKASGLMRKEDVQKLLNDAKDGDIIQIQGWVGFNMQEDNDFPLTIKKKLTFEGGANSSLTLSSSGVLLGADVTFKNMQLEFANPYCNAIMANGHTLTLDNISVHQRSGRGYVYVFCGGFVSVWEKFPEEYKAASGPNGTVIFKGSTNLGKPNLGGVCAGSYHDNFNGNYNGKGYEYAESTPNESSIDATVIFDPSMTGKITGIYACGAWMLRGDGTHPIYAPVQVDVNNCPVSGAVTFKLYGTTTPFVSGATGSGNRCASVVYDAPSGSYNDGTVLHSIASLRVENGTLIPAADSDYSSSLAPNADITVKEGAALGFNHLGNSITLNSFTGGGSMILGENQTLTINGTVSEETKVGLGSIYNGASGSAAPANNTVRIKTSADTPDTAFHLLPHAAQPEMIFVKDENGNWSIQKDPNVKTIVQELTVQDVTVHTSDEAILPTSAKYVNTGAPQNLYSMDDLSIAVNGNPVVDDYGSLAVTIDETTYYAGFSNGDVFSIDPLPEGTYTITFTIPAESASSGSQITATAILTVVADSETISLDVPQGRTFTYTGEYIYGIPQNSGYNITVTDIDGNTINHDGSAYALGTYTSILTLNSGYQWSDGSTGYKEVRWSIAKPAGASIPAEVLHGEAPVPYSDNANGKILGTTSAMEYAASEDAEVWNSCKDAAIEAAPGTYWVRMKETDYTSAGAATSVTVPPLPTLKEIGVYLLPGKTAYQVGDTTLDVTGMVLSRIMSDGTDYPLDVTNQMVTSGEVTVTGFSTAEARSALSLTVTYGEKTAEFEISVLDENSPQVSAIEINSDTHKTAYRIGDALDLTDLTIEVEMTNGTKETVSVAENMVSGFDSAQAGSCEVTITYWGASTVYLVHVEGRHTVTVTGEGAVTGLSQDGYFAGDTVSLTAGARDGYTFEKWESADVSLTGAAAQTVTFTMPSKNVSLSMVWKKNETSGDNKPAGEVIPDGTLSAKAPIPYSGSENGQILGTTSAMEYKAKDAQTWTSCSDSAIAAAPGTYLVRMKETAFALAGDATEVTVPTVETITVNSDTHKTAYRVGDTLDVTNLTIEVKTTDGTKETVDVKAAWISNFDSAQAGNYTLTITYGVTTTYNISVTERQLPFTTALKQDGAIHWVVAPDCFTGSGQIIMASYGAEGQLLESSITSVANLSSGSEGEVSLDTQEGGWYKVFLLDAKTFLPLTTASIQNIEPS